MAEVGQLPGQQFYLELFIKGIQYNPGNIMYLVIREWIFNILPTIEFQIVDDGYLTEVVPLEDDEDIEITLGKNEDDEDPIRLTFSLDDYTVGIQGDNRKSIVTITGHLKVEDIFQAKSRSFSKQNSARVLEQVAIESGLSFQNPHSISPTDNMTWYQAGTSNYDFIRHVLDRAYLPNDVMFFFANTQNNFVYTSLLSEMNKDDFRKSKFSVENYELNVKNDNDPDDTLWFTSYSVVNYSGYFNKKIGYGFGYSYYDLNKNQYKQFSDIKTFTDLSFRDQEHIGKIVNYHCCHDYIERNLYGPEYFESFARNEFLKDNFFANSLVLNANALSEVNLMDTIDLDVPSLFASDESNEVMSGLYLVAGVQHEVSNGGIYKKKIAVGRNGMNKSPEVTNYGVA